MELCWLCDVARDSGGQQVEEHLQKIKILTRYIGDLKDRAHSVDNADKNGTVISYEPK